MITTTNQTLVRIRWLIRRDLPEILAIDGTWEEETFLSMLRKNDTLGYVAEHDTKVIGFILYSLHQKHIELLRFKVHEQHRRLSIGRQLITKLKTKLCTNRRKYIIFDVSENNLELQLFLQHEEFIATRVIPQHFDENEDGYRFKFQLTPPEEGEKIA